MILNTGLRRRRIGFAISFMLICVSQVIASPIAFVGGDDNALSLATMPNSVAASNAWDSAAAALGTIHLTDFESIGSTGPVTSLVLAPGVTMSISQGTFEVTSAISSQFIYAFNTTIGGSAYAAMSDCPVTFPFCQGQPLPIYTFSFANPIQAFGLYITGRGQRPRVTGSITYNNPGLETVTLSDPSTFFDDLSGQFGGFTDAGSSITSVRIAISHSEFPNLADTFAFDDVRWVPTVPEPASVGMLALSLFLPARVRRR